jgi:hypothetical protein
MNVFWAMCLVVASVGVAVAAILLVRRRAPDGGCFNDSDRASGVFGVLATGFAITIGFVVFLAFTSYDSSKAGAGYARSVVHEEWPRLVDASCSSPRRCFRRGQHATAHADREDDHARPWAA